MMARLRRPPRARRVEHDGAPWRATATTSSIGAQGDRWPMDAEAPAGRGRWCSCLRFHTARSRGERRSTLSSGIPDRRCDAGRPRCQAADQALRDPAPPRPQRGRAVAAAIAQRSTCRARPVYHLLAVMQERGFVVHLPEERRYGLGIAAFELSSGFSRQQPLTRLGRPRSPASSTGSASRPPRRAPRTRRALPRRGARAAASVARHRRGRAPAAHLTAIGAGDARRAAAAQLRACIPDRDAFASGIRRPPVAPRGPASRLKRCSPRRATPGVATEHGEVTEGSPPRSVPSCSTTSAGRLADRGPSPRAPRPSSSTARPMPCARPPRPCHPSHPRQSMTSAVRRAVGAAGPAPGESVREPRVE